MMKQNSEWEFPKSARGIAFVLIKELLALNTLKKLKEIVELSGAKSSNSAPVPSDRFYIFGRIAFYLTAAVAITYFHAWPGFLMFWVVPIFTAAVFVLRIRSIAEHFGLKHENVFSESRTTYPSLLEKIFIAPHGVNYHLDHHLYPSVPFYRLPELHRALMQAPAYSEQAHITRSYWNVLRECMRCKGDFIPRAARPTANLFAVTAR